MVTYTNLITQIVKLDGRRACDIAEAAGLPDHLAVRAIAKLADPYQLVTFSEVGPLGVVRSRYPERGLALTAARNAWIELDEALSR
jgi:hypothetical protein